MSTAVSCRTEPARAGQRAHDLRLGPQPDYVAAERSHLNRVLLAPRTNDALREAWREVKERVGKKSRIRSNQNLAYSGIVTFGTEAQRIFERLDPNAQDAAFREVAETIARTLDTELTGLVVHVDESAVHAHYQLMGIGHDGAMMSQKLKRGMLGTLQTVAGEVMGRHAPGITRGVPVSERRAEGEDYAATVHRQVRRLHTDLPVEIAAKEAELEAVLAKLAKNEALAAKAWAKAQGADERAEKAAKRAGVYENRVETARAEVERLQGEVEGKRKALADLERRTAAAGRAERKADEDAAAARELAAEAERRLEAVEERAELAETRRAAAERRHADMRPALERFDRALAQKKTRIESLRRRWRRWSAA